MRGTISLQSTECTGCDYSFGLMYLLLDGIKQLKKGRKEK
jgi:hypothetical protein